MFSKFYLKFLCEIEKWFWIIIVGFKYLEVFYLWFFKSCYLYNGDIVVDWFLERNDVYEKMIDCIRYRVDLFFFFVIIVEGVFDFLGNWGEDDVGFGEDSFGFDIF